MGQEECEHNQPFWECEICGNVRTKKETPTDKGCSDCKHIRVCYLHRMMTTFFDDIKSHPVLRTTVVYMVNSLAEHCDTYEVE